jgi:uncharacterized membrane protein YedE/YeeE
MPLSDGEQRRLDEIESALQRDDPTFGARVSIDDVRHRRWVVGGGLLLIGMVGLLAGLVVTAGSTWVGVVIGVAGFLIMVAAAVILFFPHRRRWS